jgi:hypothetical protein
MQSSKPQTWASRFVNIYSLSIPTHNIKLKQYKQFNMISAVYTSNLTNLISE